jgi:hypothetical protein
VGIGFVLIILAIFGCIAAVAGALVLVPFVGYLTRKASGPEQFTSRMLLLCATAALPFACLFWGGAVFVGQAVVNVFLLNRDVGIGDGFDVPLPNGYELSFIDTVERGYLWDLRGRSLWNADFSLPSTISDVVELQLAEGYMLGTRGPSQFEPERKPASYFLFDTKTHTKTDFESKAGLNEAAAAVGVKLALEPAADLYYRYRPSWFDLFAFAALVVPPMVAGVLMIRWILRLRRQQYTSA